MRAVRYYGPGDIRVDDIPEPVTGDDQVKIKVGPIHCEHPSTLVPARRLTYPVGCMVSRFRPRPRSPRPENENTVIGTEVGFMFS